MNNSLLEITYFKNIPYDIREYIWSFNYSWAINKVIYSIQKYIQMKKQKKINHIYEIISITNKNSDLGIYDKNYYIYYNGTLYSKNDVFKLMTTCKCCSRHQQFRPNILAPWQERRFSNGNITCCSCNCSCRHMARFICRSTYGVYDINH